MKFEKDILYIWIGGSCDYGHKERAGGGAYIAEICEDDFLKPSSHGDPLRNVHGTVIDTYTSAEFNTTEFRMMLKSMIHAMEKFSGASSNSNFKSFTRIEFLSNVQYLLNFDKKPVSNDIANADLIEKCIELKHNFESVVVKILPFHKFPQQNKVHSLASEAMKKLRSENAEAFHKHS